MGVGLAVAALTGCYEPGPEGEESGALSQSLVYVPPTATDYAPLEPASAPLRRLTKSQYHNILHDLFGDEVSIPALDEPDTLSEGLVAIGSGKTTFSSRAVNSLEKAALGMALQVIESEDLREAFVPCTPTSTVDATCAKAALAPIARHVWRRSATDEELDGMAQLAGEAAEILGDFHAGLRFGIAQVLQSPHFIFRAEVGEIRDGQRVFTGVELASRLSLFLWNTGPDAELLEAAESGALSTQDGLLEQAQRLLESPRARIGLRTFFIEYLQLQKLHALRKDPTIFEHFDTQLGADALEETLLTLEDRVFDNPGDFRDIMTSRTTFVSPHLAAVYGLPSPAQEGFERIQLPEDGERRGLLGQVSFLGLHAHEVSTSATRRGLAVRWVLLCQPMPQPPVDVDTSIPEPSEGLVTLRDRVQEHMENESCAACHRLLDPIGLGLENFDGIGRWRDLENDAVIDPSGDLDGVDFAGPSELAEAIRDHPAFVPCVVQKLTSYARGRSQGADDQASLDDLYKRFASSGHDFRSLVLDVIVSPLFRQVGDPTEEE